MVLYIVEVYGRSFSIGSCKCVYTVHGTRYMRKWFLATSLEHRVHHTHSLTLFSLHFGRNQKVLLNELLLLLLMEMYSSQWFHPSINFYQKIQPCIKHATRDHIYYQTSKLLGKRCTHLEARKKERAKETFETQFYLWPNGIHWKTSICN